MRFILKEIEAGNEKVKISVKDKKLIQLLIQDGRASISELSKKIGISKPAVVQKIKSLQDKNILLSPVLYSNVKIEDKPTYFIQISTGLGYNTKENASELLSIEGIAGVLWWNGEYNLSLLVFTENIQELIEKIEKKFEIKKYRLLRAVNNWFHPPYVFSDVPDKDIGFSKNNPKIDEFDRKILKILYDDSRKSILEISSELKSAPITIKKRIVEMKKSGAIISFSNYINFWVCGREVISILMQIKGRSNLDNTIKKFLSFPQTGNIWELEDEWNLNVILWVSNQKEVNDILEKINREIKGITNSEVYVLASLKGK